MWKSTATGRDRRRTVTWVLLVVVLLLATALAAYAYGRSQSPAGLGERDRESLALYAQALDTVRDDYVDQEAIDSKKQTYGAIEGMLDTLGDDGHTRFLTPEERVENREGLSGTYVGIGIQLEEKDGEVVVASPIEGSPADRAGIEAGDVVVAVDGKSVREEGVTQVVEKIKGPEGTQVKVTVSRDGEERVFDLERAEIESPVASWTMIPSSDVAFVRLSSFSDDSAEKLAQAFEEARSAGARRFILDLRNNPGGRLDQAVRMAGDFLEPGSVVYIREDASGEREEIEADGGAERTRAPLAVLVNGGTASSSEILAGALRDNNRAPVIGETTFGTGTVLSEFVLRDGSAILLGVAEWLTPDGDFIRESGIQPDIRVPLASGDDPLTPTDARDLSRDEILERDAQLARAFENLQRQ
ncbi:MAG TPA: S41 family peptidase [Rubrobacteraceae bacterium]|nr:S41 family peptidase [Rubrobacteraceae bacterium]